MQSVAGHAEGKVEKEIKKMPVQIMTLKGIQVLMGTVLVKAFIYS